MELIRPGSAKEFQTRAGAFLVAHEAEHNLLLGISAGLMVNPSFYPGENYFTVVEDDGAVVAAALRTPPHNLILSLTDPDAALEQIASDVYATFQSLPGVIGPAEVTLKFAEIWQALAGQTFRINMAERIYELTEVNTLPAVPGNMRRAVQADRDLLIGWLNAFHKEASGETDLKFVERSVDNTLSSPPEVRGAFLWENEGQVVCMSGYSGPTPHGMRIGPVYTPPDYRRKGYATGLVAQLSQQLLDEGRKFCFLFTDLSNSTSNHIYQTIGYRPVCDVDEYKFSLR
jgi:uncharacterized protein